LLDQAKALPPTTIQWAGSVIGGDVEGDMSASSGQKRRRRRERQFLAFHESISMRTTRLAVGATFGLVVLQVARTLLSS
jgi:hypothetical protein